MSSFQNSVNQLIGSASYYTSINPGLREAQAERKNTQRALTAAEKANEALSAVEKKNASLHPLSEENVSKLPISKVAVQENYDAANAFLNTRSTALRNKESALGQLYSQQPSEQTLDDYLGAQRARMEFEKSAGQTIKTRNEFLQFWDDLEEAIGPVRSNKVHEFYEKSTPVGGNK